MPSFRLAGIPVTVQPTFLLVAVLIGLDVGRISLVVAWLAVVFVSVLVHEFGHALTARSFGADVEVELNGFGGLTTWSLPEGELPPGRRAAIAAAGSAAGLLLGGLAALVSAQLGPFGGITGFVVASLIWVNVFWGLVNWAPIRPLDGGHLLESALQRFFPDRAEKIGNVVFFLTAVTALVAAVRFRLLYVGLIAVWLVWIEVTRSRSTPAGAAAAESPGGDETG